MDQMIRSLHHVTATVAGAQDDLDFYVGLLGQRLVKKTVNFDNTGVYHFYYGNEAGTPGTIMTTFPYAGMGVRQGVRGEGQITVTSFSVPTAALPFWRARLADRNVPFTEAPTPFGEDALRVVDPSGLTIRLVGTHDDPRPPWTQPDINAAHAIRGIFGVTILASDDGPTLSFLTDVMDGNLIARTAGAARVGVGGTAPGHIVEIERLATAVRAVNGLGTVHHVAFAVEGATEQLAMRRALLDRRFQVTEVMDRQYFQSIYFREPGGVLFEIATIPPGFATDEPLAELGRLLKLPPWEESRRADIAAALPSVAT